jgi:hypothetical protein
MKDRMHGSVACTKTSTFVTLHTAGGAIMGKQSLQLGKRSAPIDSTSRARIVLTSGRRSRRDRSPMHQPNRLPLLFADAPAEGSMLTRLVEPVVQSAVFALVGVVVFALAFWVMAKVAPFSIRKEIEHDQNTALGIIVGSIVIGLAMIIASAIKG